jgi:hypothetical protein
MQPLEVSGAVRPIYESLGVKRLKKVQDLTEQSVVSSVYILGDGKVSRVLKLSMMHSHHKHLDMNRMI